MPSGPLNPGVDVIVAAGIVVVPVVFNCAAENTNTALLPLSLTHRFPLPSNVACCGNTKLADEIVTAGVGAELLDRFDNCFAVMSDRYRAEPDFWSELPLNVEKSFSHYTLTFPLKFDASG